MDIVFYVIIGVLFLITWIVIGCSNDNTPSSFGDYPMPTTVFKYDDYKVLDLENKYHILNSRVSKLQDEVRFNRYGNVDIQYEAILNQLKDVKIAKPTKVVIDGKEYKEK